MATALPERPLTTMHLNPLIEGEKEFKGIGIPDRVRCFDRAVGAICDHELVSGALVDQREFEELASPDWP